MALPATPRSRKVWIRQGERESRAFKGRRIHSIDFTEAWIVEKIRLPGNYTVGSSIGIVLFGADGRICRRSPFRKTARTTIFPPVFHSTEQQPRLVAPALWSVWFYWWLPYPITSSAQSRRGSSFSGWGSGMGYLKSSSNSTLLQIQLKSSDSGMHR